VKAGTSTDHISAFWDFLPTACEIAGVSAPEDTDGISFLPTLIGEEQKKHEFLYWEFMEKGGRQAIRMDQWKGVRYKTSKDPDAPIQLYDLSKDIEEHNDLAADHPEIVNKMKQLMKTFRVPSDVFQFDYEKTP